MMDEPLPIPDDVLMAHSDGLLPPAESERVARWLEAHPDKAAEVMAWRRQNEAIGALYPPVQGSNPAWASRRSLDAMQGGGRFAPWRVAAALLLVALIGGLAGWAVRDVGVTKSGSSDALIADAIVAHRLYTNEKRHAVEVVASEEDHLVSWLSNRIERQIGAPDLAAQGYSLVGGRLLPRNSLAGDGPAAQLMYENAAAERLTLYITAGPGEAGRGQQFASVDGHDAFYWANELITCTVVGNLPRAELEQVARQVYRQLDWAPGQTETTW